MSDSFLDQDYDSSDSTAIAPPIVQWMHGSGDPNHPEVISKGGFEAPQDRFGEIAGLKTYPVKHGKTSSPSYIFPVMGLSVLAIGRKQWFTYEDDRRIFLPEGFERQPGQKLSSRVRLYAVSRELGMPVLVTFTGTSSKDFFQALNDFKQRVISKATQMKAKKSGSAVAPFPLYFFWMEIQAGTYKTFDQGGYATPPILATSDFSDASINSLYVGKPVLDMIAAYRDTAKAWQTQEDNFAKTGSAGMGGNNGHTAPEEPPAEFALPADSPLTEDEIPF